MMRHALRVGVLMLAMGLVGSARAEAGGLWDWLEELNGPGPSRGFAAFMANVHCFGKQSREPKAESLQLGLFELPKSSNAAATCIYFEQRLLNAEDDSRFHPVDVNLSEFGISVWVHPAFEVGGGVGKIFFNSRNNDTGQEFDGSRWTFSFPRVAFKPFLVLPYPKFQNPRWGAVQFYFKESLIFGTLSNADFASKEGTVFERRHQRVESMGLIIDFTLLGDLFRYLGN
jgi:hypothetical protein